MIFLGSIVHLSGVLLASLLMPLTALAAGLPDVIARVKPSIVAVGTYMPLRQSQQDLRATGFMVGGRHVATNSHVVPEKVDEGRRETLAVYVPAGGNSAEVRPAKVVGRDAEHDLCLLRFDGPALPGLRLEKNGTVREGQAIAFTGFPILAALGLRPATHSGIVAAITPVTMPVGPGQALTTNLVDRLGRPFDVYQLDAIAYPGNSGSPVYDPNTGRVLAVVNSTFVKETKESAITAPSGISYAIPVSHVRALLAGARVAE